MLDEAISSLLEAAGTSTAVERACGTQRIPRSAAAEWIGPADRVAAVWIGAVRFLMRYETGLVAAGSASRATAAVLAGKRYACTVPPRIAAGGAQVADDGTA